MRIKSGKSRHRGCDCRVAHPFAEAGSCFSASAKGWDSIHYSSRASVHDTSVRARLQSCQKSSSKKTLPCAAGSRADAPSKPVFGLLGRNAAKRAKNNSKNRPFIDRLCSGKERDTFLCRAGAECLRDGTAFVPRFVPAQSLTKTNSRRSNLVC